MYHEKTAFAARGKWKGILLQIGVPPECLTGKHGPCPICQQGTDRFRFDNREQRGTYFCSHCGAGDGMQLAMAYTGKKFAEMATEIDNITGNLTVETARAEMNEEDRVKALRSVYLETKAIVPGDLADAYLTARKIGELVYPKALRFGVLRDGEGGIRPCMVALVGVYGEPKLATMHRTFLRPDGKAKAEMERPRKLMPGPLPEGACVALSDYVPGMTVGIAEGIETAMSASAIFGGAVWAALNAGMMEKWNPPEGCKSVAIYGDNDANFTGQASAYGLARRLTRAGLEVTVHIPARCGDDWNDVLMRGGKE